MRLPLLTQLDMPQGMCPYIKEHHLGLPRRLGRLGGGPSLRLRHPGDALNLRLLLLSRSALKPPLLQGVLRPRRSRPSPRGGLSGVGVGPLAQHRRLSGPLLTSMEDSGSRCLGRGVLAKVPSSTPQASHGTGSSGSRLLQSPVCGPEGFRGVVPRHRPIHPGHLHRVPAISHGDSSVRPSFHSPRRLDDLIRSSGRLPPGSDPSGIASVSSLHHGRSLLSVQGAVLRVDNCPSGLYTADGSNIRHSPSLRYQDAQIPRRLVDSSRI